MAIRHVFFNKLYESDHVVKIMCWSNLPLYNAFYRQMRVQVHRQDAFWELPNALSLHFPVFLGPRTLSHYACAAKSPGGSLVWGIIWGFLWRLGPGREPLRRAQVPLFLIQYTFFLIQYTCYLRLDPRHLIPDTWDWYLYLIPVLIHLIPDTWDLYLYL